MPKTKLDNSIDLVAAECIAVRLRMLNRVVTRIYDNALRPFGIKVSQMNILIATGKMKLARPAEVCEKIATGYFHAQPKRGPNENKWLVGNHFRRGPTCSAFPTNFSGFAFAREGHPSVEASAAKSQLVIGR